MGESVTEATVARWFKKEGDAVKRDEPLLELETDKVTVEVPAPADGAIESISVKAGDTVRSARCWAPSPKAKPARRQAAAPKPQRPKAEAPKPAPRRAPAPAAPKADAPRHAVGPAHRRGKRHCHRLRRRHRQGWPRHQGRHAGRPGIPRRPPAAAPAAAAPSGPRHNAAREEKVR